MKAFSKHNSPDSCWVILYGAVYDVTDFLSSHPGGSKIILQLAGQDATEEYDPVHPPGTLESNLKPSAKLGTIDPKTLPQVEKTEVETGEAEGLQLTPRSQKRLEEAIESDVFSDSAAKAARNEPVDLSSLLNIEDIEAAATPRLRKKAWAYYYSAGDDLMSKQLNNTVYRQILLRPRIFVDCTNCDTSTTFLGHKVNLPIYVSPAAMARLAHPAGENGIAKAAAKYGALQVISNNASQTPEDIVKDSAPGQIFGWQLYVQTNRAKSEKMIARINKLAQIKFIALTLDAPVPGKREHDERSKNIGSNLPVKAAVQSESGSTASTSTAPNTGAATSGSSAPDAPGSGGVGVALFAGTAPDLTWQTTLPWLAKHTKLPIVLKGVQTHEDAYIASQYAPQVKAIILSNHGGRALDTAPPAVHTLLEIRKYCPEVFDRIEVWVDGGIKRGTDVVKALCLGAKGVGIGRPPLFALGAGGIEGVERVFEILKAETETCMRLLGAEKVEDLGMHHINVRAVERDIYDGEANLQRHGLWSKIRSRL
ncbi:hypothetical protein NA57DRAFT_81810 [Rhizodiscina lignyota]|uniref:L-lactate dehydrogenase (cytochrome) n=1 Tax=Rhizodiscina lignyota TaxID=1504668 RepID=A0A9P4M0V0_9PEZI|nr:hypothetical protein NA57DRAFT_81810 [Rhizodiscina lignyota]